ncbi:MAG: TIGR00730 family Rossman fold protein [Planctomycetota bacterium]
MFRVCVYCGSSPGRGERYLEVARELGRELGARGHGLVYGGAKVGLMGAVADAALAAGASVHGVIPHGLVQMEVAHTGLSTQDIVDTLHERKARMDASSNAFVALPGGHGTLEELFEALTWLQLAIHTKPVALLDVDRFYDPLIAHLDRCVAEGFLKPENRALLLRTHSVTECLDAIEAWRAPTRSAWRIRQGS